MNSNRRRWALLTAVVSFCVGAAPAPAKVIASIDLSKPFQLPRGAAFTATQGPNVRNLYYDGEKAPGLIHLCVRATAGSPCEPDLSDRLTVGRPADTFSQIHFLDLAELVYPKGQGKPPLLHLQVASFQAFNGDQIRAAELLAYRPAKHRFEIVFHEQFSRNNNQAARYVVAGALRGAMITIHPTQDSPFAYWVAVYRPDRDDRYQRVLRYRSATRYGDANTLSVTDSEFPNILKQLGLWKPGEHLPLPKSACPHPRLVKMELWCS